MSSAPDRIVALEVKEDAIRRDIEFLARETERHRNNIHKLRNDVNNTFNIIRENHNDLKQLVLSNSSQISIIIERYEKIEKVVSNNTAVMSELKGGIKLGVWVIGSIGGLGGLMLLLGEGINIFRG